MPYRDDIFHGHQDSIVEYLQGTCYGPSYAISKFELDCEDYDVEDLMLEYNYELCPCCGWWAECHEMIPSDNDSDGMTPDGHCDNCR